MRILVTGGSGLLGKSLLETASGHYKLNMTYYTNKPPYHNQAFWAKMDVRDRVNVFDLFELIKPHIVIHCASIGNVDYAETNYVKVRDVNVGGLGHVIDACLGCKSKLVYVSSNAVFSGRFPPYDETSVLNPINSYGAIKCEAEQLVRKKARKWLIIRPFLLYGWPYKNARGNWVTRIYEKLELGKKGLALVDDKIWMPTYAPDCADAIWKLLFQKELDHEIFNVAAPERTTLYQFGLKVCDVFGLKKSFLKPVGSEYFNPGQDANVKAKRPTDTSYDLVKLTNAGIVLSDVRTGLEKMRMAQKEQLKNRSNN